MQIVIDILAEDFEKVKYGRGAVSMMRKAIQRGIPLPKGHGRLIDADKLTASILCQTFGLRSVDVDKAQTIIEADAESEDKE